MLLMKTNKGKKNSHLTLILTWGFTGVYTLSFLNEKNWIPLTEWVRKLYEPLYHYFFGG